jgi:hypothetical protein
MNIAKLIIHFQPWRIWNSVADPNLIPNYLAGSNPSTVFIRNYRKESRKVLLDSSPKKISRIRNTDLSTVLLRLTIFSLNEFVE